jgi:hypothetical protein
MLLAIERELLFVRKNTRDTQIYLA